MPTPQPIRIGIFAILSSCVFFTGCSEDRSGVYVHENNHCKVKADLRSDGSAEIDITFPPGVSELLKFFSTGILTIKDGKWAISGNEIIVTGKNRDGVTEQKAIFRPEPNGDLLRLHENPDAKGDRYIKQ